MKRLAVGSREKGTEIRFDCTPKFSIPWRGERGTVPFLEAISQKIMESLDRTEELMGVLLVPREAHFRFVSELPIKMEADGAMFDLFDPRVSVSIERMANDLWAQRKNVGETEKERLDFSLENRLIFSLVHEWAHFLHYTNVPAYFRALASYRKFKKIKKEYEKNGQRDFILLPSKRDMEALYRTAMLSLAVTEGVATMLQHRVLPSEQVYSGYGDLIATTPKATESIQPKGVEDLEERPHKWGSWFLVEIEQLTELNPIPLVIYHPPQSIVEFLDPEQYIRRLRFSHPGCFGSCK